MKVDTKGIQELLRLVRENAPEKVGLLSVELLLLVAKGPRSTAQLEKELGLKQGRAAKALWPFLTRARRDGEIRPARLALLKRVRRPGQSPMYHLSVNGWRALKVCGLL